MTFLGASGVNIVIPAEAGIQFYCPNRSLATLRENLRYPCCRKMLARLRLPPSVHDELHFRLWNRRFHPFNVYPEEKRREKLNYMHNNPVKRGLVGSADRPALRDPRLFSSTRRYTTALWT
jgi:hypothetical protein